MRFIAMQCINAKLSFNCRASCYRVQLGDLKKIYNSEQTPIFQDEEWMTRSIITWMEADLKIPGNIVLSIKDSLYTTDGETIQLIATQKNAAIQAFYQLNKSSIVVPDLEKRCMLLFDRDNSKFFSFAGDCDPQPGSKILLDGGPFEAETSWVSDIIRGEGRNYSQNLFFIDFDIHAIATVLRLVNIDTQYVETLHSLYPKVGALCWEYSTSNILIGGEFGITRLNLDKNTFESVTVAGEDIPGRVEDNAARNGPLLEATFLRPNRIINIVENMYVTVSQLGVQVIDLTNMYMHSVCTLSYQQSIREGNITLCQTPSQVYAPLYFDGHLYFSVSYDWNKIQIARIKGKDFGLVFKIKSTFNRSETLQFLILN